jgi:hypothetical protein
MRETRSLSQRQPRLRNQYMSAGSASFAYDVENRLVVAAGTHNATLRYDPLGRLYEVVGASGTTRFLYAGDDLVAEYDGSGNLLRRYVHGADATADDPIAWYEGAGFASTTERLLRPDWEGSIVLVTDTTGSNVLATNSYDKYGIPAPTNTGRFQYTSQVPRSRQAPPAAGSGTGRHVLQPQTTRTAQWRRVK